MKQIYGLLITLVFSNAQSLNQHAVIITPVADLVGEPLTQKYTHNIYNNIPVYANSQSTLTLCPRIHQALFNEKVTIFDETDTEYGIEISNTYYITEKNTAPQTRYWTLKKNCYILEPSSEKQKRIPTPITFKNKTSLNNKNIITLIKPWHDTASHKTFSVGTRFIFIPEKSTARSYTITFFDAAKNKVFTRPISKDTCLCAEHNTSHNAQRHAMINLIRSWITTNSHKCIPYVWGGCSYTSLYTDAYTEIHTTIDGKLHNWYQYPHKKNTGYHSGFDCAGLILRAAQCVGIPFFCKNSYTMHKQLTPIKEYAAVKPGDILWIPGHVMLLADLERNTLIEARGYSQGYGKLHEIPIHEQFKDINTIHDIIRNQNHGKPLYRLNKEGTIVATIPSYTILKLF